MKRFFVPSVAFSLLATLLIHEAAASGFLRRHGALTEPSEDDNDSDGAEGQPTERDAEQSEGKDQVPSVDEEGQQRPPSAPFAWAYENSDQIERDLELRQLPAFTPEGTNARVDMKENMKHQANFMFEQEPSVFKNCILIRDFAEPLRVGSAIQERSDNTRRSASNLNQSVVLLRGGEEQTIAAAHLHSDGKRLFATHRYSTRRGKRGVSVDNTLPASMMVPKGGVMDRDTETGEFAVNMYAFLSSVAGKVPVIPNGFIAKWGSKKKVPLAGYLCTGPNGPVLHTLDTPCLPTALNDEGEAFPPPPIHAEDKKVSAEVAAARMTLKRESTNSTETPTDSKLVPSSPPKTPARATLQTDSSEAEDEAEAEAEAEAAAAQADSGTASTVELSGVSLFAKHSRHLFSQDPEVEADTDMPAPEEETADQHNTSVEVMSPRAPTKAGAGAEEIRYPYHVWVGAKKLAFSSKPKADDFCARLAERIADDMGDTTWDTDDLPETEAAPKKTDLSLASFARHVRTETRTEWTRGTKTLLVVVMDWMDGDMSSAPISHQRLSPDHYERRIFPRVREAFQKMSYGQFDLEVTVLPHVIRYRRKRSRYAAGGYPFPGLHDGARMSLDSDPTWGKKYNFDDYDLTYVISPQQQPVGTKGVAWVGAKGAMCNGCEELSENFQVMVAVHELGHNLGLFHAGSSSLEYGNVFDWMGNYPDVTGLSYGLGYKMLLGWVQPASIAQVTDANLQTLNDEYILRPFDVIEAPRQGEIVGIRFHFKDMPRDLYVSYRETTGMQAGVYLTWQAKDKPDSELIDCACHSPSQQDARLQEGWTYMDPLGKIVLYVSALDENAAVVRAYRAPTGEDAANIRSRPSFTDGKWKCPRTCQDSDLLVSMYQGCSALSRDGYCNGGSISMSGRKYTIDKDLCPRACDRCDEVTHGGDEVNDGCADRRITISGMSCREAAAAGHCNANTNLGHIGTNICPMSCGSCPPRPSTAGASGVRYRNPTPERTHGSRAADSEVEEASKPPVPPQTEAEREASEEQQDEEAAQQERQHEHEEREGKEEADEKRDPADEGDDANDNSGDEDLCTDDGAWRDEDMDGCDVYALFVKSGKLTRSEACDYGSGEARAHCRKTCNSCLPGHDTCEDKECVTKWLTDFGSCFACSDWPGMCHSDSHFKADCPKTCGTCSGGNELRRAKFRAMLHRADEEVIPALEITTISTTTTFNTETIHVECKDEVCVPSWLQKTGKCYRCKDFAEDFCGRDEGFMQGCPRTCRQCVPHAEPLCEDDFKPHTCRRQADTGGCGHEVVALHCKATCGFCNADGSHKIVTEIPKSAGKRIAAGGWRSLLFFSVAASVGSLFAAR